MHFINIKFENEYETPIDLKYFQNNASISNLEKTNNSQIQNKLGSTGYSKQFKYE